MPYAYFVSGESSPDRTATFSASNQTNSLTTDTARLASNGNRPMKIIQVRMYLAGRNASRTCSIGLTGGYNGNTGNFTVSSGSAAANTGFKAINTGFSSTPSSTTLTLNVSGETYMGNNLTSGSNSVAGISGRTLWGQYQYVQVPATPSTPSVTGDRQSGNITVSWSGNSDWGDSSSGLGYKIDLLLNGTLYQTGDTSSTSITFFSMPSGYTYTARVYAYNELISFSGSPTSTVSGTSSGYFLEAPIVNYTVSYNSNGGSNNPSSQTVQSGNTVTLPSPGIRSGYSFNGWVSSYNGGVYGAGSTSHAIVANTTFTASWTQLTWTVSFNGNGGTTPSSITVTQGQSLTLPNSTRTGYSLNGWYTASSGGSYVGTYNTSYTPSSNITLYAQWTANVPGFTDENIIGQIYLNQDIADAGDNSVSATNATSYSIISSGTGLTPTWLSISSSGTLSGSTNVVGIYTFKIEASGPGGTTQSNEKTLSVVYAGERIDGSLNAVQITTAKRYDGGNWIDLTIMRRFDGNSWIDITN
jgi:uncharacterized repeat protein (TIGR02543 family)